MSSPTIKDVAKLAGVSISTVSRVMNDSKPVSPEARRKVLDAIEKLDFKPNELARSLVMKRSNLIGVVVKDIGIPYMAQIVRGAEEIGRMYKYDILLSSTYGDLEQEKKIIDFMFTKQVEGIILISEDIEPEVIFKLKDQTVPYIQLDKFWNIKDVHTVQIDYKEAMINMINHIYDLGHKKILFVKENQDTEIGQEKLKGYRQACDDLKIEKIEISSEGVSVKDGYEAGDKIFEMKDSKDITCVSFSEDAQAIGFINYCYDNNKKVPDDISVSGFGDIPMTSIYRPTLTTVQEPYYDIGAVSMRTLVKVLKENKIINEKAILGSQIMKRESVKDIN